MPSGSVTRSVLRGSPSGSISTAATTGSPVSTAPSRPVRQTALAFASWPFGHTFVQGEKLSLGCSPCGCCGVSPAFGCVFGTGALGCGPFGAGAWASACDISTPAAANTTNKRTPLTTVTKIRCLMGLSPNSLSRLWNPTGSSHRLTPTAPAALANKDARARGAHTSARHVRHSRLLGLTFKPPARIFGTLLKLVLQFLLLRLENLRIRWRTVIGLGEIVERQHQADWLTRAVDALHHQPLSLLQLPDQFATCFIVGHAAVLETDHIGPGHRLALIDNHARARLNGHAERQSHTQNLFWLVFGLDQHGGDYGHA